MRLTKTIELAILLCILVAVVWVEHVLTNTSRLFVPAAVILAVYYGIRLAVSGRRRGAGEVRDSHPHTT
jgi:hypothetical protein